MLNKIFIRVDGSAQIGLGHLVRCIALAQMLKNEFDIHFVYREVPTNMTKEIEQSGFDISRIETEDFFFSMLSGEEIVVLDNYFFEPAYQKKIKDKGSKLVCIDDLHDKEFFADLIINQVPGTSPGDYIAQIYTQFALGPEYALLRAPFLEQARKEKRINKIETALICFGGADNKNLTTQTLEVVLHEKRFKRINVITGAAFNYTGQLQPVVKSDDRVQHYHALDEDCMLDLMTTSDLAIVPASGILLEVLAVGCKVISGMYVDNQKFVFEEYKKAGFFESAENFSKQYLITAIDKVFSLTRTKDKIIDGCSVQRIVKKFRQLALEDEVVIREVNEGDVQKTFEWASNLDMRKYFFNKNRIEFEEHSDWFFNKLSDKFCYYFILSLRDQFIGSIRFDLRDEDAEISYLVDPAFHNHGLGMVILKKGIKYFLRKDLSELNRIIGVVLIDNIPSIKIFKDLGFKSEVGEKEIKFIKMINENFQYN